MCPPRPRSILPMFVTYGHVHKLGRVTKRARDMKKVKIEQLWCPKAIYIYIYIYIYGADPGADQKTRKHQGRQGAQTPAQTPRKRYGNAYKNRRRRSRRRPPKTKKTRCVRTIPCDFLGFLWMRSHFKSVSSLLAALHKSTFSFETDRQTDRQTDSNTLFLGPSFFGARDCSSKNHLAQTWRRPTFDPKPQVSSLVGRCRGPLSLGTATVV